MIEIDKDLKRWAKGLGEFWARFKRNKVGILGLFIVCGFILIAIFAPLLATHDPGDMSAFIEGEQMSPPNTEYWFGTDIWGYDIYSRTLYGARTALLVGLGSAAISFLIGATVGALAGSMGRIADETLMGITSIFLVIPILPVALLGVKLFWVLLSGATIASMPGIKLIMIVSIIGFFGWPDIARLTRGEFLRMKEHEFVEAARSIGASRMRIIFLHILPNVLPSIVVTTALKISFAITLEASISFLGFGDQSLVSWGQMLSFSKEVLKQGPWTAFFPGIAVILVILGFNALGDGLNDALNPRLGG